jgi:hypothetical protein
MIQGGFIATTDVPLLGIWHIELTGWEVLTIFSLSLLFAGFNCSSMFLKLIEHVLPPLANHHHYSCGCWCLFIPSGLFFSKVSESQVTGFGTWRPWPQQKHKIGLLAIWASLLGYVDYLLLLCVYVSYVNPTCHILPKCQGQASICLNQNTFLSHCFELNP